MPADFEKCVKNGGKVITKDLPDNKYIKICYDKDGKSHAGEVKKKSMKKNEKQAITMMMSLAGMQFSDDNKSELHVLSVGEWDHPAYGRVEINDKVMKEMVGNFNKNIRAHSKQEGLPVDEEHFSNKGAVGWIKKLINRGSEGLFAVVEWNKKGRQAIEDKIYKFFSPEFYFQYEDPETRRMHNNVLIGGALTNRPYFKDLKPVVLSEDIIINNKTMQLSEILKKDIASLSDEEKELITSKFSELSEEEKKKFDEFKPEENEEEDEDQEEKEKIEANENKITMSENEVKKLKEDAAKGVKASEDLRKMQVENKIKELTFSEANKDGKLPAKANENNKIVDFVMSLSEELAAKFYEIINNLPSPKIFGELGESSYGENNDEKAPAGVSEESHKLDVKAREIMKSNDKMTYEEALMQAEEQLSK